MQYQLQIKQLVSYPRCRIYRQFLKSLSDDRTIRTNGSSDLFCFMTLCSLANFRTSRIRIDGTLHTIAAGEWIMPIRKLTQLLRKKSDISTIAVLEQLQSRNYITYSITNHRKVVRFRINNWEKFNTVIEANAPCQKDDGFFFFPYKMVSQFIGQGKCSEMDIVLDLWLNTIYNDERIEGSDVGPVVYYRNGTHSPLVGYEELGKRWGVSKSTAGRILRKLESHGYLKLIPFPGSYGTAIYLNNYLSTMFNISDVTVDKDEVAMSLGIRVHVPDDKSTSTQKSGIEYIEIACRNEENQVSDEQIDVPENEIAVPKPHLQRIVKKAARVLSLQGIACASCAYARLSLSPLSDDCKSESKATEFFIRCPGGGGSYRFAMKITPPTDISLISESEVM